MSLLTSMARKRLGNPASVPIGYIYNQNSWSSLSGLESSGASVNSNKIILPVGSNLLIKLDSVSIAPVSVWAYIDPSDRKLKLTDSFFHTIYSSSTALSSLSGQATIWLSKDKLGYSARVTLGLETITVSSPITYSTAAGLSSNTVKAAIYAGSNYVRIPVAFAMDELTISATVNFSSSYEISSFSLYSPMLTRMGNICGDSLVFGFNAGGYQYRYGEQLGLGILGGPGDKIEDLITRQYFIRDIVKPKVLLVGIGTNNGPGVTADFLSKHQSFVSYQQASGATVLVCSPPAQSSVSMKPMRDALLAQYPTNFIDLFGATADGTDRLRAEFNAGSDGIHVNGLGNTNEAVTARATPAFIAAMKTI